MNHLEFCFLLFLVMGKMFCLLYVAPMGFIILLDTRPKRLQNMVLSMLFVNADTIAATFLYFLYDVSEL